MASARERPEDDQDVIASGPADGPRQAVHTPRNEEPSREKCANVWHAMGLAIYEASPDGVALLDLQGRLLCMNRAGHQAMAGDGIEVATGCAWHSLWQVPGSPEVLSALQAARSGNIGSFRACGNTGRPDPTWWDVRVIPVRQQGKVTHMTSVARDITGLVKAGEAAQQAQAAAEKARQVSTNMVAMIGHEVRTPLAAISGLSGLLLRSSPTPAQREHLDRIQCASSRLALLMDDLLDLSEAAHGSLQLHVADFDFRAGLERSFRVIRQMCEANGLGLRVEVSRDIARYLAGDTARLSQMLLTCATAAARIGGDPELRVQVRVARRVAAGLELMFEVTRHGAVLDPADLAPWLPHASNATSSAQQPPHRGREPGIALCQQLAHRMGGEMGVTRETDRACTFWFTVQLSLGRADGAELAEYADPSTALGGRRVLVVEDDALARDVLRQLLELAGMEVAVAPHGAEALTALQTQSFDAVLMDLLMPVMDGLEATRRIRNELGLKELPVIALSGSVLQDDRNECAAAGASDFIAKPVDAGKLWGTLTRWMPAAGGTGQAARV